MVLKNIKLVLLIVLILVLSSDNISFASVIEIEDDVIAKKSEITDSLIFENGGLLSFNVTWNDSFTKTINSTITLTNNENIEKYYNVYLVIEENGTLYPLEMKKHADPQKKDMYAFDLIDKIPGVKRGSGGIICMYDKLVTLKDSDRVIPINYL